MITLTDMLHSAGSESGMLAKEQVLNNLELTSIIFQWLKCITFEELVGEDGENEPNLPVTWTAPFARLATVNRAFFHGSIEVLWERLDSAIPPFQYALPADRDQEGRLTSQLVSEACSANRALVDQTAVHSAIANTRSPPVTGSGSDSMRQK